MERGGRSVTDLLRSCLLPLPGFIFDAVYIPSCMYEDPLSRTTLDNLPTIGAVLEEVSKHKIEKSQDGFNYLGT